MTRLGPMDAPRLERWNGREEKANPLVLSSIFRSHASKQCLPVPVIFCVSKLQPAGPSGLLPGFVGPASYEQVVYL